MDIPLPDEIPLPSGRDDSQPMPPGEGPPRPRGKSHFPRPPRPSGATAGPRGMNQPRPPSMFGRPPQFQGGAPPYMQLPPPPPRPSLEEKEPRPASERYSPSRVTGDDDEQPTISSIFSQEENFQHSASLPAIPSESNSQSQQSISAIFDSFLTPPPQIRPPVSHAVHEQPPSNRYHPMPPQFPMNSQPPLHGPHNNRPRGMPMAPPHMPMHPPGMPMGPSGNGPPGMPGGPPLPPGSGPSTRPPHHHGPPGSGPPPRGPRGSYFSHRPPYQPYTSNSMNQPTFTPHNSSPGNRMQRPFRPTLSSNSKHYQNSKYEASQSLSAFNEQSTLSTPEEGNATVNSEVPPITDSIASSSSEQVEVTAPSDASSLETEKSLSSDIQTSEETKPSTLEGEALETSVSSVATSGVDTCTSSVTTTSTKTTESTSSIGFSLSVSDTKTETEKAPEKSESDVPERVVKKIMPKVLGKHGAKKRLLAYSGKLNLIKTTKQISSSNVDDEDDGVEKKKAIVQTKKKKKEEKMSSIEQIKNEESRIKEALGLKNVLFSPFGPGLAPIAKLLDNPDELLKFEFRGKQAKIKHEEYVSRSKIREREDNKRRERSEKERVKKDRDGTDKEKDKDKGMKMDTEKVKNEEEGKADAHNALDGERKSEPRDQDEPKKKPCILPKDWKTFNAENYNFESLRLAIRDHQRRHQSRSRERNRFQRDYSHDKKDSKDEIDLLYQQNRTMHPVHLRSLNGMRLQYPARLVHKTKSEPKIFYGINHHRYDDYYSPRTEIKARDPELWGIVENFLSAKPVYPRHKKHSKGKLSRPWFREELEDSKSKKKESDVSTENVSVEKDEKKSKESKASQQPVEKSHHEVSKSAEVKKVDQEVAKAATKSRWDSDNEEGENSHVEFEKDEVPSSMSESKSAADDDLTTENDFLLSDSTNNADGGNANSALAKAFPDGLNEEYEAFMEILEGGSEVKEENDDDDDANEMPSQGKDPVSSVKMDKEELGEEEVMHRKSMDDEDKSVVKDESVKTEVGKEENMSGEAPQTEKKVKSEKKLKKQLKKAKKKEKRAKKKAKKKAKKVMKKKKTSKKESKKNTKKGVVDEAEASDSSVVHVKDYEPDNKEDVEERNKDYDKRRKSEDRSSEERLEYSERKRRTSLERKGSEERLEYSERKRRASLERRGSEERLEYSERKRRASIDRRSSEERLEYSDRKRRASLDRRGSEERLEYSERKRRASLERRSSEERLEYSERKRRSSPERRDDYDRRRGFDDARDFNYRREGRGYFRGRGGDRRRDEYSDFRGRFRGHGYERRGRGRGFNRPSNFRDRRDSFSDRRNDYDDRAENPEDYEVHREFIREKRYEWKEAHEEGRNLRKERQERRLREKQKYDDFESGEDGRSYSPSRHISDIEDDDDDDDIKSVEQVEDGRSDMEEDRPKRKKERRLPSPAPSPSPSPSPERIGDSDEELYAIEDKRSKSSKKTPWDLEESNTNQSWKSKDSSPIQILEDLRDDEKASSSTKYPTSDTSGYYDLSSAPSSVPDLGNTEIPGSPRSQSRKHKNNIEISLDEIPYPPEGPSANENKDFSSKTQIFSDRYSPSLSVSPTSPSPYNSPRSQSPSLQIPLPPSVHSIPVPPVSKISENEASNVQSDLKGISLPPTGIPLPSSTHVVDKTTSSKVGASVPSNVAYPSKVPIASTHPQSPVLPLPSSQKLPVPPPSGNLAKPVAPQLHQASKSKEDPLASLYESEGEETSKPVVSLNTQESFKSSIFSLLSLSSKSGLEPEPLDVSASKESDTKIHENTVKKDILPTKWVESNVDEKHHDNTDSEDRMKTSRSLPITFRLGGSKQATIKRLQKGPVLPEFDHDDEEEGKIGLDLDKDDDDDDDRGEYGSFDVKTLNEKLRDEKDREQSGKPTPSASSEGADSVVYEEELNEAKDVNIFDRSKSKSVERSQPQSRSSRSPQRIKTLPHKETSPNKSPSRDRSKSPKSSRSHYKSKSPSRNKSPARSRSPQRNRSPKRNRSPRRSRSRSWSPKRTGGRRSPPRKRRVSPEYRRYRCSPERGRRREFGSPRRSSRYMRDGRSPPPRSLGPRSGKDRWSPKRYSRSPSPFKGDRFASPDSKRSRTPEKTHASVAQGPRTPEPPISDDLLRSPPRPSSPIPREKEFRGSYKEKLGSRSPDRPPSPGPIGRRSYASPPGGRRIRKDYRGSRSPNSRSPDRWHSRHRSPIRRSPNWSPSRPRMSSPGLRSPYRSPDGRSQYSPGREKISPGRRWSPVRSRSPRRSPLRKSPLRRSHMHRSSSRSPLRRSRSRSPIRRSSSRSPIRRSPARRWSRSPLGRRSPLRRSPLRRSPLRRSPGRSPLRRSPLRRSPSRRSRSPLRKSPCRSPRSSRSPSKDYDYEHQEKGGWSNWKWEKDQGDHKDTERWAVRPPSPKEEPSVDKYYTKKPVFKEGTLKIDADSTISDSELTVKKEPMDSSSPSPHDSPRRLSLDERLQKEHGLELEDHSKKRPPPQHSHHPLYNWGYQAHPIQVHQFQYAYEGNSEGGPGEGRSGESSSKVIQVGNMLQVLPQDPATSTAQPSMIVQQVLPQEPGATSTPSPMIVQTGNVIQVVPAENMLGTDVVSSAGVMGMGGVVQVVTGGMIGSSPTPVPAPLTSSASAVSKSSSSDTSAAISSVLSSLSSIQLPGASVLASSTSVSQLSQPSSVAPVTTLAANTVTQTTSSTHAAGLPVAHLISLLQQQQMASLNESAVDQEAKAAAKEKAREVRKELKEKRRLEREARREARQKEKAAAQRKKALDKQSSGGREEDGQNSDTEDEVLIREAIYEVPTIGSPVPDYEIMRDEDDEEDDEEALLKKKRRLPVPLPPAEKGILMSPSYRYQHREVYHPKAVKFADGVLPGEGTSPSGGEEIHSPPPPGDKKPKEKKLKKKRKVKVKIIKEYKVNDADDDSPPPPPPGSPPPPAALKLYPGYTHYSYTAPGTCVIYAQQPQQTYTYTPGQTQGAVTVPGGMVIQQGANAQPQAALGSLGGVSSGVFRYPGYVYTTVYSAGQQLQYVLPGSLPSQPSTSSPQKTAKK